MTDLFKKLNFKSQPVVVVLNAPDSFRSEMKAMEAIAKVKEHFEGEQAETFAIGFAIKKSEVDSIATIFAEKTAGDATLWLAYPKGSSKKYKCDFNRDTGWDVLGQLGFEPVKQIAIDEDWSALRFRRIEFIKTMSRSFAMTEEGKKKAAEKLVRDTVVPDDLLAALNLASSALSFFEQMAPSHKKEYITWINDAKRAETRERRIAQTVELLLAGKKSK